MPYEPSAVAAWYAAPIAPAIVSPKLHVCR